MKFSLWYLLCYLGFHQHKVVDVKLRFGDSGRIIIVKCKNCGIIEIKNEWKNCWMIKDVTPDLPLKITTTN